jgi:hypothetical protein
VRELRRRVRWFPVSLSIHHRGPGQIIDMAWSTTSLLGMSRTTGRVPTAAASGMGILLADFSCKTSLYLLSPSICLSICLFFARSPPSPHTTHHFGSGIWDMEQMGEGGPPARKSYLLAGSFSPLPPVLDILHPQGLNHTPVRVRTAREHPDRHWMFLSRASLTIMIIMAEEIPSPPDGALRLIPHRLSSLLRPVAPRTTHYAPSTTHYAPTAWLLRAMRPPTEDVASRDLLATS